MSTAVQELFDVLTSEAIMRDHATIVKAAQLFCRQFTDGDHASVSDWLPHLQKAELLADPGDEFLASMRDLGYEISEKSRAEVTVVESDPELNDTLPDFIRLVQDTMNSNCPICGKEFCVDVLRSLCGVPAVAMSQLKAMVRGKPLGLLD